MDNTLTAQELRIGNLLQYFTQSVFVMGIKKDTVELGYYSDSIGFERFIENSDLNPIELSPEWLSRFQAIYPYDKDTQRCQIGNLCFWWSEKEKALFLNDSGWEESINDDYPIYWVHQLQNVFHSLTGSELVLKQ